MFDQSSAMMQRESKGSSQRRKEVFVRVSKISVVQHFISIDCKYPLRGPLE